MTNYFELYGLPISFRPDAATVKNKFYELSRLYHPDRFAQAESTKQIEALRMAAANNEAYKILNNPYTTMGYILRINDMLEDEEKYNLPPDFLMEMMEINEAVSEYELEPDNMDMREEAIKSLETEFEYWDKEVGGLIDRFEKGERDKALLSDIKDYYFRKKYLLRIKERIATFAAR